MRLINTETFELKVFSDDEVPPYAILSHTWGPDSEELTFSDITHEIIDKPGIGSFKFKKCCEQAKADKCGYAWIDTCCINKNDLVELGEAINSMFRWYSLATVCYAYLSDVPAGDDPSASESKFRTSRWFKRGWTLQELLAPKHEITSVPRQILLGVAELHTASVAQRMSWAAQRETKRAEDLAYCLLGIFGITMPMIYGEGEREAFFRLQEQIMKTTRDDSILAWDLDTVSSIDNLPRSADGNTFIFGDILATHTSSFRNSGQIITREHATNPLHSLAIVGGNLSIYLPMFINQNGETFGLLSCGPKSDTQQVVAIPLAKINSVAANEYVRPRSLPSVLHLAPTSDLSPELIHIKKDGQRNMSTKNQKRVFYEEDLFTKVGLNIVDVYPQKNWDNQLALISQSTSAKGDSDHQILIRIRQINERGLDFVVIIDFDEPDSPVDLLCCIFSCHKETKLDEIATKFPRKVLEAFKKINASNGFLHLHLKLESMEGSVTSIIPEVLIRPPDYTINATVALKNPDILESISLLWEKKEKDAEMEGLRHKVETAQESLQRIEEERKELESQIRELERRKGILANQESREISHTWQLEEIQEATKKRQEEIPKQIASAQKRLKDFYHDQKYQDAWTPFRSAIPIGDVDMMDLLFDVTTDIMAEDQRWKRWITASITGDAKEIRLLLATDETELEHKDGIFGRTPLSWASMKGHRDVVELLLDTDKVDIRDRDNHDRTPLHFALDGGYHDIARLMLRGDKPAYLRKLRGHRGAIFSVAFSHDSKLILSGSVDSTVMLWDSTTGKCLRTFQGHGSYVQSVAFSHVSKVLASGSDDRTIKLWDSTTGECLHTFQGHRSYVHSVAFSHDSEILASGSYDKTIKLWDSTTGECLHTFQGHDDYVISVAFSHDSKILASGSQDGTIKLWDSETGKCFYAFQNQSDGIISVAFSHDSRMLASRTFFNTIKLWDSSTRECLHTFLGHGRGLDSVAFSHDSKLLAAGTYMRPIELWDSATGECLYTLGAGGSVPAFSHDSKLIAAVAGDAILLWDVSIVQDFVTSPCYQEKFAAEANESRSVELAKKGIETVTNNV
ncbi:hypothetical protein ACHAPE_007261 [Trichoderma viride]